MSPSVAYERFDGGAAMLAGMAGFLYSVAFIVVQRSDPTAGARLSAIFLTLADLPSQVDPRGLLSFGLAGVALLTFSWLIAKEEAIPIRRPFSALERRPPDQYPAHALPVTVLSTAVGSVGGSSPAQTTYWSGRTSTSRAS